MILMSLVILLICISCGKGNGEIMLGSSDITKVKVSKSEGFGGINENSFYVFDDLNSLRIFGEEIEAAEKQSEITDMIEPEYDLLVEYGEGEDAPAYFLHLWLGEENSQSTVMYVGHDTTYRVPKDLSQKLRRLFLRNVAE